MHIYVSGPAELHADAVARLTDNGMTVANPTPPTGSDDWPPANEFVALVNAEGIYLTSTRAAAGTRGEFERNVAAHLGMRIYGARA